MPKSPKYIANHLRQVLLSGASAPHTEEVQRFFKDEIASRGWYTGEIRKLARRFTKVIRNDAGLEFLVSVSDQLFRGRVLEEKVLAVFLLETSVRDFGDEQFKLFETWLDRVSTWADHDSLLNYLIGPMMVAEPKRTARAFRWAKSPDRWHRRAAAVALIRGARFRQFFSEIEKMTSILLRDEDDMVLKGLGWLLREAVKYDRETLMPLIERIRETAPRLVLRTACETLSPAERERILAKPLRKSAKAK